MAGPNELLIKINADAKNAIKAFDDVQKQTDELSSTLNKASLVGAAAFAALSAEVFVSARAFSEAQLSANALTQALQNQGIFTVELRQQYKDIAEAISEKTGVDDDQIIKAQAIAQGYLGQTKITKELAQSIVDLGAVTGDLNGAAALIGRTVGTSTNALARQGVVIREGSTQAERLQQVTEQLAQRINGQAEAANKASLGMNGLRNAFDDVQKGIGARFAPAIEAAATALTKFLNYIKESPEILDFAAALIAGGLAASGIVAVAGPLVSGFLAIKAALVAAGVAAGAVSTALFAIPLAIAAVVAGATYLALNWNESMVRIQAVTAGVVAFVTSQLMSLGAAVRALAGGDLVGLKDALVSAFDGTAVKAGVDAYVKVTTDGFKKIEEEQKKSEERQNVVARDAAVQRAAEKTRIENLQKQQEAASDQIKLLQLQNASKEAIAVKQEELAILKDLETEKNAEVIAAEEARLVKLRELNTAYAEQDKQQALAFEETKQAALEEFRTENQPDPEQDPVLQAQIQALQAQEETKKSIRDKAILTEIKERQASQAIFLENERKFGTAYATIYQAMQNSQVNAFRDGTGQLAELANSRNSTLKGIGKAAAIANITIDTARGALAVYANFQSAIPFPPVSIPLGLAAAAALTAYGAERIAQVNAAADGALVGGARSAGGTGDRRPFMLEDGELVAPARNFDEVVEGVQTERSGIIDELRDRLANLESNQGGGLTVVVQGDFVGDETYAEKMGRAISDAIQFGNLRFVGVNT